MLQKVWQKISGKSAPAAEPAMAQLPQTAVAEPTLSSVYNFNNPPEALPDKYLPLWKLQSQRQIIEIKLNNNHRSYQTLIMAIDVQRGIIWLDDLFPSQHLLDVGDEISLRHNRNGKQLSFSSPVVALGKHYGASGLAILLPEDAQYESRRQNSRFDVSHKNLTTVKIRQAGYDASFGTLQDLSLGGLRLRVAGNLLGQLQHGELLPVCELKLSDELNICCSARVRAFRIEKSTVVCTHISVEFVDLPLEKQKQLQSYIGHLHTQLQLQRELYQPELTRRTA